MYAHTDAEIGRGQGMEEASRSLRIAEEMKSRLLDARENLTVAEAALRDAKKEVKVKEVCVCACVHVFGTCMHVCVFVCAGIRVTL